MPRHPRETLTCLLACVALLPASAVFADDAPRSFVATPDVYRATAENEKTKVVLAAWRAGRRDNWHSHPATGLYFITDCEARIYTGNSSMVT